MLHQTLPRAAQANGFSAVHTQGSQFHREPGSRVAALRSHDVSVFSPAISALRNWARRQDSRTRRRPRALFSSAFAPTGHAALSSSSRFETGIPRRHRHARRLSARYQLCPYVAADPFNVAHIYHEAAFVVLFARQYGVPEPLQHAPRKLLTSAEFVPHCP